MLFVPKKTGKSWKLAQGLYMTVRVCSKEQQPAEIALTWMATYCVHSQLAKLKILLGINRSRKTVKAPGMENHVDVQSAGRVFKTDTSQGKSYIYKYKYKCILTCLVFSKKNCIVI